MRPALLITLCCYMASGCTFLSAHDDGFRTVFDRGCSNEQECSRLVVHAEGRLASCGRLGSDRSVPCSVAREDLVAARAVYDDYVGRMRAALREKLAEPTADPRITHCDFDYCATDASPRTGHNQTRRSSDELELTSWLAKRDATRAMLAESEARAIAREQQREAVKRARAERELAVQEAAHDPKIVELVLSARICDAREVIAASRKEMVRERRAGAISGVIDKAVMHEMGLEIRDAEEAIANLKRELRSRSLRALGCNGHLSSLGECAEGRCEEPLGTAGDVYAAGLLSTF